MNLDELNNRIAALKDVKPVGDSRTFMYKVPFSKKSTFFFVRPLGDDLILASSVIGAADEVSIPLGQRILDAAEPHAALAKANIATKIPDIDWGLPNFDSLLLFGPAVVKFSMTKDDVFLRSRTVAAYAIHHIEYSGDETEAEAVVRRRHAVLADITREITPVIFLRYHKQTGQRSEEFLAIAKHERATAFISEIPRDGGTVDLENWQRVGMSLSGNQGDSEVDTTFDGKTKKLTIADALKLMDTLTMKSADEAKKGW
jgi:hypothetical protein